MALPTWSFKFLGPLMTSILMNWQMSIYSKLAQRRSSEKV